jgi:hypothetical protein
MRAFDVLTKAELDIRASMYPRYHLEMALLRWIHLRKLVPLSDLIQQMDKGGSPVIARPSPAPVRSAAPETSRAATAQTIQTRREAAKPPETAAALPDVAPVASSEFKDAFLAEIRRQKKFFYGTVIAQAQRIDVEGDRVNVVFSPQHRAMRAQLEQTRPLLETIATQLAGRRMTVAPLEGSVSGGASTVPDAARPAASSPDATADRQAALREQALADSAVQTMLDVFAAEIKEVEER